MRKKSFEDAALPPKWMSSHPGPFVLACAAIGFFLGACGYIIVMTAPTGPRAACGAARGACDELAPSRAQLERGQVEAVNGRCPPGGVAISGSCWLELAERPPCRSTGTTELPDPATRANKCWAPQPGGKPPPVAAPPGVSR